MNDFLLVFRNSTQAGAQQPSPQQMQDMMKRWQDWIGGLAAQDKLVDRGNPLLRDGKVVKAGGLVTNGPYADISESIGGYTLIRAESLEEAARLTEGCPIFEMGGSVEVRQISPM